MKKPFAMNCSRENGVWIALVVLMALSMCPLRSSGQDAEVPNVILIMTDDQGIGDLGVMGNPVIETPNVDRLANQSSWLTNFYVHPVCTPTRACLMTGRYNYRTRAIDTYIGRAMMEPDETTIAELLQDAGYATGIFGKWHLGDCYPMRAIDQGFSQAVIHRGGGIGQPSDPLQAAAKYTDPILFRNGIAEQFSGYCTDIYYDEAIKFIQKARSNGKPFFVYLPDNCPHGPFNDVPQDLYEYYKNKALTADQYPQSSGHKIPANQNVDRLARIYAMIGNIDRNVGRLLGKLDELTLSDNTIVIYLHDNGPNSQRYVNGYRGNKSSVYEGGIRSPFFVRWPDKFAAGKKIDRIAAHIDVLPTVLSCCKVAVPADLELDGRDLSPLLLGNQPSWPDRTIVIQSHRGDQPAWYHHFAIRNQRWKLLHHSGFGREDFVGAPNLELYDMSNDPMELINLADQNPNVVADLRTAYENWFSNVSDTRPDNFAPPRIVLGAGDHPTVLTRQDWRRSNGSGWGAGGQWLVTVPKSTKLSFRFHMLPRQPGSSVELQLTRLVDGKRVQQTHSISTDSTGMTAELRNIQIPEGDFELSASYQSEEESKSVYQIELIR